jgi:hypothetical protein
VWRGIRMMSFSCSYRNKTGAELHIYLKEGTYHKRLFRRTSTNDIAKEVGDRAGEGKAYGGLGLAH